MSETLLNRKGRMDVRLLTPEILSEIASSKELEFLLYCVQKAFCGRLEIAPSKVALELSTSPRNIRKWIAHFIELGIIEYLYTYEYKINYYKHMLHDKRGYVPLFQFLFENPFMQATLPQQRAILYLLGELSKVSHKTKIAIPIDTSSWYGRDYDARLFPLWHRSEITEEIMPLIKQFFDINDSRFLETNHFILHDLKEEYDTNRMYSAASYHWMRSFLDYQQIYYIHDYHLKHLVGLFESIVRYTDFEFTREVFGQAFLNMYIENTKEAEKIISQFTYCGEEETNYSNPVFSFRETFLVPALVRAGKEAQKISFMLEQESERYEKDNTLEMSIQEKLIKEVSQSLPLWQEKVEGISSYVEEFYLKSLEEITRITDIDNAIQNFNKVVESKLSPFLFFDKVKNKVGELRDYLNKRKRSLDEVWEKVDPVKNFTFYNWLEN